MTGERAKSAELLRAYLEAGDAAAAERAMGQLLAQAEPLIEAIVRSKLGRSRSADPADVEDVCSDAAVALISRLGEFRNAPEGPTLAEFEAFTAVIAYRACSAFFRRARPEFHRLRNRLRYLLETQKGLAIWEDGQGVWWCASERTRRREDQRSAARLRLEASLTSGRRVPADPVAAVNETLDYAGGPVPFDDLAHVMASVWNVQDKAPPAEAAEIACPAPSAETSLEQRQWVEQLWREIGELPPRQRSALLLNLHDQAGESVTTLLAVTRVASLVDIAKALEMTVESFAGIWRELPWSDLRIAGLLGITRQQVINLRKCARERLCRRMLGGKADWRAPGNMARISTTS